MPYPAPQGFLFSGVQAGLKASGKRDLGLIYCARPGLAGAVFTQNLFPAAPVLYDQSLIPLRDFRALIVNAGNANAATGAKGVKANLNMASAAAELLEVQREQVLTSSTGVIGQQLDLDKIIAALPRLHNELSAQPENFSQAILTTDLVPKLAQAQLNWQGKSYQVLGVCKGSGMIMPNMATLLAYVLTDAPITPDKIQEITLKLAERSFNCLSVDTDTSTNDSFFLLTSDPQAEVDSSLQEALFQSLLQVSQDLAQQIAADGEGAKHLIEVSVKQARNAAQAKSVMMSLLNSPLVKTAIHGQDPNWGRLLMAIGKGLVDEAPNLPISITLQGVEVFTQGEPQKFDYAALSQSLGKFEVSIEVDLKLGSAALTGWGCDLSREYIAINADYTT